VLFRFVTKYVYLDRVVEIICCLILLFICIFSLVFELKPLYDYKFAIKIKPFAALICTHSTSCWAVTSYKSAILYKMSSITQ
jgi:hypothetical protein